MTLDSIHGDTAADLSALPADGEPSAAEAVLHSVFGFQSFRDGQKQVIDWVIDGRNVLAVMPTGAGKSLCYQVPALVRGGLCIVVSPLVALMQDQVMALRAQGVRAASINSGQERFDNVQVWRAVAAGEIDILYMSPERLMTERMVAAVKKLPVRLFAIDEAHCISRWGASFRPEYEQLSRLGDDFPDVPIVALTATAEPATREDIATKLFRRPAEQMITGFNRPNIHLAVLARTSWKKQMVDFVTARPGVSGIVYCLSRKRVEQAAAVLNENGVRAIAYHAGMSAEDRRARQEAFMTEPGVVMVATIAFGMGIDKPDIRFVFHTDLPGSPEAYYQEIGRAGRDGAPAEVRMVYGLEDIRMRRSFIEQEFGGDTDRLYREMRRLDALLAFCEAPSCRRAALLRYFGDESDTGCGNCDLCDNPVPLMDGSAQAVMAISAIRETGEMYGVAHIIDVLVGANTAKVRNAGHDRVSVYGQGKSEKAAGWRSLIRQMVAAGILEIDINGYGGLLVLPAGDQIVAGQQQFMYRPDPQMAGLKRRVDRKDNAADNLSAADQALLEKLRGLRRELAQTRGVPAYVVFADRSLIEMASARPVEDPAFRLIHGVGARKAKEYGPAFMRLIAEEAD